MQGGGVRINVILIKLFHYLFWRENMVMWTLLIVLLNAVRTDGDVKKISQKPVFSYGTSPPPQLLLLVGHKGKF